MHYGMKHLKAIKTFETKHSYVDSNSSLSIDSGSNSATMVGSSVDPDGSTSI